MRDAAATWKTVRLDSLGEFRNGVNFSKREMGSGLGLINVKDLFSDISRIDFDTLDRVDLRGKRGIEKYFVRAGDLFFVRSSVKRDGIGLVSVARRDNDEAVHCGFVIRFRPTTPEIAPDFLVYLLRSPTYRQIIINVSSGAAITNISQGSLSEVQIRLPPLPTQQRIAGILSAYDDLIENNTRRIALLEEMARLLYREWFVRFRFPGHEGVRMVESELGMIPEGWEVKRLEDVCNITMGQSPRSEFYNELGEGLPFHQGVTHFGGWFPQTRVYCTVESRIAEAGDILFSVRAPVGRINVANCKIVIGRGLSAIRSKTGNQAFVLLQLKDKFQEEDAIGGGTIFKAVTKSDMLTIALLMPPRHLMLQFEQIAVPTIQEIQVLTSKNTNLRRTRDLLLPRLISGEVDVSEVEIAR